MSNKYSYIYGYIKGLLVLIAAMLTILFLYRVIMKTAPTDDSFASVEARTQPVGQVYLDEPQTITDITDNPETGEAETKTIDAPAAPAPVDGAKIAKASCFTCHQTGLMNAPKVGDNQDWGARLEQGFDTLLTHALAGFNTMPARGGNPNLKDPEIEGALLHMLAESGLEVPGRVAETATTAQSETAIAPVAAEMKADTTPETAESETKPVAPPAAPASVDGAKIAKASCFTCHQTGLMSAPKVGDNQDWGVRLEQGFDTLLTHALAGFNLMPARGGNPNLKNPEIEAALLHMLAESGLEVPGRVAETAPPAPAIQSETVVTPAEDEAKANTAPESQVETDLAVAPEATTTETIPEQNIPQAAVKESEPVVVPIISSDVYKKECASCHDAGTDNAPRIGVQEAWIASIAMGIDVLARDTAKGPPAHPDIRNRKLSNDQITNAIEYIMQQTFWPVSK